MTQFFQNLPSRAECIYTSHYCEENVWHLCRKISDLKLIGECYAVFISNPTRRVVLWKQKLSPRNADYVIWDYHVIVVYGNKDRGYCVLDFDSILSFPVLFEEYTKEVIRSDATIASTFHRFFRVIPASEFLKHFSSDRRHMKIGDSWLQPPPSYQPLSDPKRPHNLDDFISMDNNRGKGQVLTCEQFVKKFSTS